MTTKPPQIAIETRRVDQIIPYARNSRTHSDAQVAQVAASIREFGFTNPVLIDAQDGIIAGHGRVLAARKLGLDDVPVIVLAHLSETQKKAYIIADNKIALNAGWNDALLSLELVELENESFDLNLLAFDSSELNALMSGDDTESLTAPGDSSSPGTDVQRLKFGKYAAEMSVDEFEIMEQRFNSYVSEYGLAFGFVSHLLGVQNA